MTRKYYNEQILKKLQEYVEKQPEQRFGQILRNIGIVNSVSTSDGMYFTNIFYEEPQETLKRINCYEDLLEHIKEQAKSAESVVQPKTVEDQFMDNDFDYNSFKIEDTKEDMKEYREILDQKESVLNTQKKLVDHLIKIEDFIKNSSLSGLEVDNTIRAGENRRRLLLNNDDELTERLIETMRQYKKEKMQFLKKSMLSEEEGDQP